MGNDIMCLQLAKMANVVIFFVFLCLIFANPVIGQRETTVVIEKLQDMDMDILNLKSDFSGLERKLSTRVGLTQKYLKAELVNRIVPEYVHNQVQEALSSIFADRTIEDMLSGYIVQKLDTLSGTFQILRRNVHVLSRRLRDVERNKDICEMRLEKQSVMVSGKIHHLRQTVSQIDEKLNATYLSSRQREEENLLYRRQYAKNATMQHRVLAEKVGHIENDLKETRDIFSEYRHQMDSDYRQDTDRAAHHYQQLVERVGDLEDVVNNTMSSLKICEDQRVAEYKQYVGNTSHQYEELSEKVSHMEDYLNLTRLQLEHKVEGKREQHTKRVSTTEVSLAIPTEASIPPAKNMDLLIAAHSDDNLYFQRLDLHKNSLSNFPLRINFVHSIMYVPSRRSVMIGYHEPYTLAYHNIDTHVMTTIRKEIMVFGMALDQVREQIFMTTQHPRKTVSSMNVDGRGYRGLLDLTGGNIPHSIAVDSRHKMIYVCVLDKLLRVTYDGHIVQTVSTGSSIRAVALDLSKELLYYNDGKNVVRTSLNGTERKEIFQLEFNPQNFVFYNESIYVGTNSNGHVDVLFLGNKGKNVVQNRLQTVKEESYSICLIPRPGF